MCRFNLYIRIVTCILATENSFNIPLGFCQFLCVSKSPRTAIYSNENIFLFSGYSMESFAMPILIENFL